MGLINIIGYTISSATTSSDLPGPDTGDGILLEDGASFLQLESGDFLLLE